MMNTQKFNSLLDEIESGTCGSVASVVRKLREHEVSTYQAGIGGPTGEIVATFIATLDQRISERNVDIERTCNNHYKNFADATCELLKIQKDASLIKNDMVDIEKSFFGTTSQIASLNEVTGFLEEIRKRSTRLGVLALQETLSASTDLNSSSLLGDIGRKLSGADINTSASSNISNKNVFVSRNTEGLNNELEELTQLVQKSSIKNSGESGESLQSSIRVNLLTDFGPVYRCLHIHTVLNEKADFERFYCNQRKKQLHLCLSLSPNQQANMKNYSEFFGSIVGFFLIDDTLRHTLAGVTSTPAYQTYLEDAWTHASQRLVQIIQKNANFQKDKESLVALKDYAVLFSRTIQGLGFPCSAMQEMVEVIRRRFEYILCDEWNQRINNIMQMENYTAMVLNSKEEEDALLADYPLSSYQELCEVNYPKNLPFSPMVPSIYKAVRDYIDHCRSFSDKMNLSWSELEDNITRAVNCLFTECINSVISRYVRQSENYLLRLIQLSVNMSELEQTCTHLEIYIQQTVQPNSSALDPTSHGKSGKPASTPEDFTKSSSIDPPKQKFKRRAGKATGKGVEENWTTALYTGGSMEMEMLSPIRARLQGAAFFKDSRAIAEELIYQALNTRVDEFCSLAAYENMNNSPNEPSGYVGDMMSFLRSTFVSFTNLPPKIAQTACISVCKHVCQTLQGVILGDQVKLITEDTIRQVSIDLTECEHFAKSDSVTGIDKSMLILIFQDLRQLLTLLKKDDWNLYFQRYGENHDNPYDRVTPSMCIRLLERLREGEKRRTGFMQQVMNKEERDKKKRYDEIIKHLRELLTTGFRRT